jgi:imidazoleglycerol phosphate synthase glutamine amidotransferase subunit HisH
VVQQLSQVLEENRAQTLGIVNGVQAIQARATEEGGVQNLNLREVNGELNGKRRVSLFKGPSVADWRQMENRKASDKGKASEKSEPPATPIPLYFIHMPDMLS